MIASRTLDDCKRLHLPVARRTTLCGQRRPSAKRAKAGPRQQPDQAAQQPRANAAASDDAEQIDQRRLPGRHRQLAPLPSPRPRRREALPPPLPPATQGEHRDPPLQGDRLQACAAGQHQCAHHEEQRRHTEPAAEDPSEFIAFSAYTGRFNFLQPLPDRQACDARQPPHKGAMGGRSQQDGREGTRRLAERRLAPIRGVGTQANARDSRRARWHRAKTPFTPFPTGCRPASSDLPERNRVL